MDVLFVCREKQGGKISPITMAQANSLNGLVDVNIFTIQGRGWRAYIKGISCLRKYLRANNVDLIHAHYSHSAYVASLASRKPVICSLMGSDVEDYRLNRILIRIFANLSWKAVIVKSEKIKKRLGYAKAIVIPNGVDLDLFKQIDKKLAREKLGYTLNQKIVLFLADPSRPEKNYQLARDAFELLPQDKDIQLLPIFNLEYEDVPYYISAVDVILLTSHFEGSPNVIKEAMACNCPIVSTDVGDVKEIISETDGCFITSIEPRDICEKLLLALDFGRNTNGRKNIKQFSSATIAHGIIDIYNSAI